jgi:hypothetical protein
MAAYKLPQPKKGTARKGASPFSSLLIVFALRSRRGYLLLGRTGNYLLHGDYAAPHGPVPAVCSHLPYLIRFNAKQDLGFGILPHQP